MRFAASLMLATAVSTFTACSSSTDSSRALDQEATTEEAPAAAAPAAPVGPAGNDAAVLANLKKYYESCHGSAGTLPQAKRFLAGADDAEIWTKIEAKAAKICERLNWENLEAA